MGKGDCACGSNNSMDVDAPEMNDGIVDERPMERCENDDHEYNIMEGEASPGTSGASSTQTREQEVMDILDSVSDAAIEEIRRQIQVQDQPFPRPKKMPLHHYQELCRALEIEQFLSLFIKSAQAPWLDLEIMQMIRGRDRTYCLWVPTRHLPILQKVVKMAMKRIVPNQDVACYEERVSFEEMDTSKRLQRQAGGYSIVSNSMTCEYDIPSTNHIIGHEKKKSTICAFLEGNSQHYFLGTSHLTNLEGKKVYFRNEAQHAERKPLGNVLHHAQDYKPFIEAFLGKLDSNNCQVGSGLVNFDEIHDSSIWELLGDTIYMPLEGGRKMCEGKVEYLGRGKHCEDPDTGELINGSSLLYCRPIDCDNLSPPGSSGTGVFIRREEEHGKDVQNILSAMNLFSLLKDDQTWAVCQHIVVPISYFREKLGCPQLTLYSDKLALASGHSGNRDVDSEAIGLASHKTHARQVVAWSFSHGIDVCKPTADPYGVDDFNVMRAG